MKKILVIRFSSLGDILLTLPLVKNIKLNEPDSVVYYLTKKQFSGVLSNNSYIDKIISFENLRKTLKELKKENFDVIIDVHSNLRSWFFRHFLKSKIKIKYNKDSLYRRLFVNYRIINPRLEKHTVDRYLEVLEKLNYKIITRELELNYINYENKIEKKKEKNKILVIQTAFLGDLILTLPLIKEIKEKLPKAHISVLVRKENKESVEKIKEIDEIIEDKKKTAGFFEELSRLVNIIKTKKFDIAIIPHRSIRSALIAYLSGIPVRIGFNIKPSSFFYTHKVPFTWMLHDSERNMMLLSPLIKSEKIEFPSLVSEENSIMEAVKKLKFKIGINPSSVWETKRWPYYKFALLINRIFETYRVPVIITGSQKEKQHIQKITDMLEPDRYIDLSGKTSLNDLIHLISHLDVYITNDSGPMHIAAATSTAVIAIFGPTTKELGFFPLGKNSKVIETDLKCRPCRLHGSKKCPHNHFLCMKLISVDEVFKEISKILKY